MTSRLFSSTKAVLIDLSGTMHIDNFLVEGAQQALSNLRHSGLKLKFVTNTSKESLQSLHLRLKALKLEIFKSEIYTSLTASRRIVEEQNLRPYLMLSDSAKEDFRDVNTDHPNAVVIGLSQQHFNYDDMNTAFRLLLNGATMIAINKARYFKRLDGLALGTGAFVSALEFATGIKSIVVGKPEQEFFLAAISEMGCSPSEVVMIGDDVYDDVGGAIGAGMLGILVKTGKYRDGDEDKISLPAQFVARDIADAVDIILHK